MNQQNDANSDLLRRAALFAADAHKDQKRKYTGEPYFFHCVEVANLVKDVGGSPEMIAAALLHDTVEDCNVPLVDIFRFFGMEVGSLVENLTDISRPVDGNRRRRKEIDRQHTAGASPEAKTIKLADLISNSRTIITGDPDFAKVYMVEKRNLMEVLKAGNPILYGSAEQILLEYEASHPQKELKEVESCWIALK
jgi:(p)ppGpp synthase/HD superfamily hydrolase